jgi:hypothetical protein
MSSQEGSFLTDNAWGRPLGALTAPTATFRSLRERPTWLVALVLLCLVAAVAQGLAFSKIDMVAAMEQQLADRAQDMSPQEIERAAGIQSKVAFGCGLVFAPVWYLLVALVFMVLLNLIGGEVSYRGSLAVTVHALMPLAVAGVLTAVVIAARDSISLEELQTGGLLASNLGVFAPQGTSSVLKALLSSLDVFSLWCVALLSVGYAEMAGVTRSKSAAVAVVLWLLTLAAKVGMTALGFAAAGGS